MAAIKYVTWKNYAGFVARATPAAPIGVLGVDASARAFDPALHMDRAAWLTAKIEGASWGTVQSYDGVGISGGLLHHIAVDRAGNQASLFGLVAEAMHALTATPDAVATALANRVAAALAAEGWALSAEGVVRTLHGLPVAGKVIVERLSGPGGKTPPSGAQYAKAKAWAELLCDLFAHARTHRAQVVYARRWLARGQADVELEVYRVVLGEPTLDSPIGISTQFLSAEVDLAMSVYHSYSANAPSLAAKCLREVIRSGALARGGPEFAKALIRKLGSQAYGKWKDTQGDGENRYDRTRLAARRVWAPSLVDAMMPRDL